MANFRVLRELEEVERQLESQPTSRYSRCVRRIVHGGSAEVVERYIRAAPKTRYRVEGKKG